MQNFQLLRQGYNKDRSVFYTPGKAMHEMAEVIQLLEY